MFIAHLKEAKGEGRSLVVFTVGLPGLENIDSLVRKWGFQHFDYVLAHWDKSLGAYEKLDWHRNVTSYYAHRQGKVRSYQADQKWADAAVTPLLHPFPPRVCRCTSSSAC
jgi:hypothetical protein